MALYAASPSFALSNRKRRSVKKAQTGRAEAIAAIIAADCGLPQSTAKIKRREFGAPILEFSAFKLLLLCYCFLHFSTGPCAHDYL